MNSGSRKAGNQAADMSPSDLFEKTDIQKRLAFDGINVSFAPIPMGKDSSQAKRKRFSGSFPWLLLILGGTLAFLCRQAFRPYEVFWANDLPLGALVESSARLHGPPLARAPSQVLRSVEQFFSWIWRVVFLPSNAIQQHGLRARRTGGRIEYALLFKCVLGSRPMDCQQRNDPYRSGAHRQPLH